MRATGTWMSSFSRRHLVALLAGAAAVWIAACSSESADPPGQGGADGGDGGDGSGGSGAIIIDGSPPSDARYSDAGRDPTSCEEAEEFHTYLGCEYWPTITANLVSDAYDFAVVAANPGAEEASIMVTGPYQGGIEATVGPGALTAIVLPWWLPLKGPSVETGSCRESPDLSGSIVSRPGAYHLVSSRPVAAYQFNPLQYQKTPEEEPRCVPASEPTWCHCNSYSNDASLLLPVNALTGNYRIFGWRDGTTDASKPNYFTVTAVENNTLVAVLVGPAGAIQAGPDIPAAGAGEVVSFTLNQGDVAELLGAPGSDLSGTLVQSIPEEGEVQKPLLVLSGSASARVPDDTVDASDHLEEIVFPAETLGQNYVVTVPTVFRCVAQCDSQAPGYVGPPAYDATPVQHVVRLYGHVDGTELSYYPILPAGAPTQLDANDVVELVGITESFQVQGTEPFAVGSFLAGGSVLDSLQARTDNRRGDPAQTLATTVEQYRDKYVFLAPIDYEANFVDIVADADAEVTLDDRLLLADDTEVLAGKDEDGETDKLFRIYRVQLGPGLAGDGSHVLTATSPVGIQVVGHGRFISYMYPGGLNLNLIAPPPPPIVR